jgi:hypothetical protein
VARPYDLATLADRRFPCLDGASELWSPDAGVVRPAPNAESGGGGTRIFGQAEPVNGFQNPSRHRSNGKPPNCLGQAVLSDAHHLPCDICKKDNDLAVIVAARSELPEAICAGILAVVGATRS